MKHEMLNERGTGEAGRAEQADTLKLSPQQASALAQGPDSEVVSADDRAASPFAELLRQPRLLWVCLVTARWAQIALVLTVLAMTQFGPQAAERLSGAWYPTQFEEETLFRRLTGFRTPLPNPIREIRREQLLTAGWALGLGAVLLLWLANVPRAVAIGRLRAGTEVSGPGREALVDRGPGQSKPAVAQGEAAAERLLRETTFAVTDETSAPLKSNVAATASVPQSSGSSTQTIEYVGADRRYRLDRKMGGGGMGIVHGATDMLLERTVAMKQLYSQFVGDHEHSMRFRQEAMALASLTHPHIVTMYDLIEFDFHFWIVMELLDGGSLAERIKESGTISPLEATGIACDIASGLEYAHRHGIVHRDVKPLNILFTEEGIPKLADFGTAKLRESWVHTSRGDLLGSPAFMSPEQITGSKIDPRTDVYSLGVSIYQMLAGKVPFEGDVSSILAQHVQQEPEPPSKHNASIPSALDMVVLRMLEKVPKRRYQDCREVIDALRDAMGPDAGTVGTTLSSNAHSRKVRA